MQAKLSNSSVKKIPTSDKPIEVVDSELKGFLLRIQPTGRKTFYYSYRNELGKRKRIKIGLLGESLTVQQARDKAAILAGQVADGEDVQGNKSLKRLAAKGADQETVRNFLNTQYKSWALANLKSGTQSIAMVTRSFPKLLDLHVSEITVPKIERWRLERLNAGRKPTTVNRSVNALRAVLTKAVEWDILTVHPLAKLKALRIDTTPNVRYLSEREESRLLHALATRNTDLIGARSRGNQHRIERGYELLPDFAKDSYPDRMYPLVILSLKTGMRRGELFDLEWHSIDFDNKVITVRAETAKSSRVRHIPLSPTALTTLFVWKKQATRTTGRVFPADNGGRLDNVRGSWKSILKIAEITHFRWHDMRHDFASKLVMNGVPLNTVRELCGHSDLNTTLRYAHLAPDHKADAVALLG